MPSSKATTVWEIVFGWPKLTPPSKELLTINAFCCTSCQATYTSPLGPTNGSAPITEDGPPVSVFTAMGLLNVRPPSVERANNNALLDDDLPALLEALSHATYTLSRNGLFGLVSTAM